MKLYKSISLLLIILPCFYTALAQSKDGKITGKISDAQNNSVSDVAVYLLLAHDSSVVKFTLPDKNGFFEFDNLVPHSYLISVSGVGYKKTFTKVYTVSATSNIYTGIIQLNKTTTDLKQVDVTAQKRFIENRPGKITINVQSSITSAGSNALEILKRAPGVRVDNDNNILLNGKENVLILIDGRPTYMPPDALIDMLQGTQSSTIDQVELISNAGATYDAASAGGIINIKLKRNENYGTNGTINLSAGTQQIGDGYGSKFRESSGFTFNNRTKNLNIFGSYNYSYLPYNRIYLSDRLINYNNQLTEINANYFSDAGKSINTYRVGADYNISSKQIIGFLVNGLATDFVLTKNTNSNVITQGVSDSTISTTSRLDSKAYQVAFDLNYRIDLGKSGVVSADANYFTYNRNPVEMINSNYYYSSNNQLYRNLVIQNTFPSNYKIFTYNIDYSVKLNSSSNLTAILKTDNVKTHNNLDFGEITNNVYSPDPRFTNQFDFTETINAAAIDYNKVFSKKLSLEAGLRVEQTISDGQSVTLKSDVKNNYFDFFPNVRLVDLMDDDNTISLAYGRHIYRPFYTDLNPFIAYQDQYSYYMGNPNLKPLYLNTIELQNIYKGKFSAALQFSVYNNFIQSVLTQNDSSKIVITHKVNLGNRYKYGVILNDEFDLASWWALNADLEAFYNRFTATPSEGSLNTDGQEVTLKTRQYFTLTKSTKLEFDGDYETPTTYGVFQYKSLYTFSAGVSKVINKRASLALNVHDIFNTDKARISSGYQNLDFNGIDKIDFRTIMLSFDYKFGSKTVKGARTRKTGAEAEQGRAFTLGN